MRRVYADYLRRRSSLLPLAGSGAAALLLAAFPGIDLAVSRLFFADGHFGLAGQWWNLALHQGLGIVITLTMAAIVATFACNHLTGRRLLGLDFRATSYLVLVLGIGAGLIVNFGLQDHFGRARPREITEFGGTLQFSPAFVLSDQCAHNCSFSSGDAAGGFFALALARALGRRRSATAAATAFGTAVAFGRIAAGAHFLSDVVVSLLVMLLTAEVLQRLLLRTEAVPASAGTRG